MAPETVLHDRETDEDDVPDTDRPLGAPGIVGAGSPPPPPSGPNTDTSSAKYAACPYQPWVYTATAVVDAPVVNDVDSCFHDEASGVHVDTSVVPVPVAPRYAYLPCPHALSVYVEFGFTATVWVHRALSCPAGVAFSAAEPPCAGAETVVPLPAEQVQPVSPDSKPAFLARC